MKFQRLGFLGMTCSSRIFVPFLAPSFFLFLMISANPGFAGDPNPWVASSCQLYQDDQGIPHIRAKAELDGIACLGYIHARDRIWQMDYFKKVVDGRKSEFFGSDGIRSDFFLRVLGLKEKAETLYAEMTDAQKAPLKAYAHGVQLGAREALSQAQRDRSSDGVYGFQAYGYAPDLWNPEDSLKLLLLQAFDQTRRSFENQLREEHWLDKYPKVAPQLFSRKELPWEVTVLKEGEYARSPFESVSHPPKSSGPRRRNLGERALEALLEWPGLWHGPGAGSNNWVVAGTQSKTGHALLANDPHLSLTHPPFWYWAHLSAGEVDVIGATFPGMPFFPVGASQNLSWGVTNAFLPVARLSRVSEKELRDAGTVRPWIWVKWWKFKFPFFFKTYRKTPLGLPVLPLPAPENQALVLNWTGYALKPSDAMGLFELPKMKTVSEADKLLGTFGVPAWNLVFADTRGDIGYRAVGRVPRFEQDPPFGLPLETLKQVEESEAFRSPLTAEEMPHVTRPQRGWVVTANNRQWPNDSQWSAGDAQHLSLRAFRIEELLGQSASHDLSSIQKIQCDLQAVDARFLLPSLMNVISEAPEVGTEGLQSPTEKAALLLLQRWDFQTGLDCQPCAIYRRWMDRVLAEATLNPASLYRQLQMQPVDASLKKLIRLEFAQALVDLDLRESRSTLTQGEVRSVASIWPSWGHFHRNSFFHLLGKRSFPAVSMGTPGDEFSVNPGTSEWNHGIYDQTAGASQRILVEMSQPPQVYSVVAGPQKDLDHRDLASPGGEWQKWVNCQQNRRLFPLDWAQVEKKSTQIQL